MQSQICVEIRGEVEAAPDRRSARADIPQEISHVAVRGLGMSDNGQLNPEGLPSGRGLDQGVSAPDKKRLPPDFTVDRLEGDVVGQLQYLVRWREFK